jgi:AcrR family transcriptional regulator
VPAPSTASAAAPAARVAPAAPPRAGDRRTVRTRRALRDALALEIVDAGGLDRAAVTSIAERAGVTRRTFYSHFRDIPDLVQQSEDELLAGIGTHLATVASVTLDDLYAHLERLEPCPGSVELLAYIQDNGLLMGALLGPGGDPGFVEQIKRLAFDALTGSALHGIDARVRGPFFDYYLTFAVSAEVGVVQRWLEDGMSQSPELMARAMTALMFVRPGDLYGRPVELDIPHYGQLLAHFEEIETR